MHLTDGEMRSYFDQELKAPEEERVQAHLSACEGCRERAEGMASRARMVQDSLVALSPNRNEIPSSYETARARFEARRIEKGWAHFVGGSSLSKANDLKIRSYKEKASMFQKIFTRPYRPALITVLVIAVLAISLTFPSVRAIANSFLGLFRVQTVSVIQFDPGDMPNALENSEQFQQLISDDIVVEDLGDPEVVASAEEASSLAGIPVRLPSEMEGQPELMLHPGTRLTFDVDLPRVQALLDELGQGDIELPDELDGATVTMELPSMVAASYGQCKGRPEGSEDPDEPYQGRRDCTTLVQMSSPEISAPEGLDIEKLGQSYLQLLGMSPEEAAEFSQTVDWATTLIIPIPRYEAMNEEVTVDGVKGTLLWQWTDSASINYVLIWVKNDIVYSLTGRDTHAQALAIANSLK